MFIMLRRKYGKSPATRKKEMKSRVVNRKAGVVVGLGRRGWGGDVGLFARDLGFDTHMGTGDES